ncbi:MAG: DUF2071 domain-containing protein [Planctomycetota bacterium]|nr:MAG: DUF2071 domain-containing protein [Planctomycetota bacterium]REJ97434.1 MAG: DUF2071 domain-containing protein [Planctomycetota bacterium]REK27780.1 MAG: DUF2071 domain-containing protein [Planctomycetota bacterium]REK48136.1 MAG: DUF2071 domain-containing protein [Planctomycetota bacterium]
MLKHPSLYEIGHRPYPLPKRPWIMAMNWHDLLFMHWDIDPQVMRAIVPAAFELDLFDDRAWLGVVPFRMSDVRPRCVPALPRSGRRANPSHFLELNVRTYVRCGDRPGVLFFSLDAESRLAVRAARRFFHLPYFDARMSMTLPDGGVDFRSHRTHRNAPPADLAVRYRPCPGSTPSPASAGTLEYFLTERYCLYTQDARGRVLRVDIHHVPWPLQAATVDVDELAMTSGVGVELVGPPPLVHFARRLDVVAWRNQPV